MEYTTSVHNYYWDAHLILHLTFALFYSNNNEKYNLLLIIIFINDFGYCIASNIYIYIYIGISNM